MIDYDEEAQSAFKEAMEKDEDKPELALDDENI